MDATGKPRQLHVKESLECIDFSDFEPAPVRADATDKNRPNLHIQPLVSEPLIEVEVVSIDQTRRNDYALMVPHIVAAVDGSIEIKHGSHPVKLRGGEFCLVPASMKDLTIEAASSATFLVAKPGEA